MPATPAWGGGARRIRRAALPAHIKVNDMALLTNRLLLGAAAAMALAFVTAPAQAATSVMKECSTQYKADKAAGKVKAGETWTKYYAECAKAKKAEEKTEAKVEKTESKAGTKVEKTESKAAATAEKKSDKPLTPAQKASQARMKECGAMWRKDKEAGKIAKGDTWPQYWHRCSEKLKKS